MPRPSSAGRALVRDRAPDIRVKSSDGAYVFDTRGRKYVDFVMGWCVGNFGWDNKALRRKADAFSGPDYVYPGYSYEPWNTMAALLSSMAPKIGMRCFRATGGSEAVDIALQAAMVHTGRAGLMSLAGSYHGNTLAALSIGASETRELVPSLLRNCYKVKPPLDQSALEKIERRLKSREVAAFIMEPVCMNLGVLIPTRAFMRELARLCRRYGTLLIMDEVATGFGRTGTLFATEQFGIKPDMICLAKAITGGVGGLGATLATGPIAKSMEQSGSFYSTYGWHPRSTHAAIATLEYIRKHRTWLLSNVARKSAYFGDRLSRIPFDEKPELRISGLAVGIDVGDADYASHIEDKCRRNGLLISTEDSTLLLFPPLNISRSVADEGIDKLARSV